MSELSKIVEVAGIEAAKSKADPPTGEATWPEPDFSAIPDASLDGWVKRYTLRELDRRLREDNRLFDLRKTYASRIFALVGAWLVIVIAMVICAGISLPERDGFWTGLYHVKFQLSDSVIIAFITTTTVNVIALFLAVTAWLFPKEAGVHVEPEKTKQNTGG